MGTSTRFWVLYAASVAAIGAVAAGCNDNDHTAVCVGPGCPTYDGVGGEGNIFYGNGGSSGTAGSGEAGSAGAAGSPAEPPDATAPDADSGPNDPPDADLPTVDGGDAQAPLPCELAFASPTAADAGDLTLTPSDDIDGEECGSEFTIDVRLSSNARSVRLFVNENPLAAQDVLSGAVSFATVLGNRGSTANVLRAEAAMPNGDTCTATFPGNVFVDCAGPSCTIDSPLANEDGYLNSSKDDAPGTGGLQTEIVVGTELEHLGEMVRLEIDADPDAVPDEAVTNVGGDGNATFAVTLAEGERTVQAECRDAFGVTTLSPPTVWKVDVTPCTLSLDPISGTITPEDDEDNDVTNGIQVFATGTIGGSDCKAVRAGDCSGTLLPVALTPPLNGAFSGIVTLTASTGPMQLCGVVEDDAGNVSAEAQRSVDVRVDEPRVAFVASPPDLTSQNESAPLTATCETSVAVNCSELGQPVELLQDGVSLDSQNCDDVGGTAPFLGRATFASVSLLSKNDGTTTTLTARQAATGFAPGTADVTLHADCEGPACTLSSPSASIDFLTVDGDPDTTSFESDFSVVSDPTGETARLILDGNVGGALSTPLSGLGGGTGATFPNVLLAQGPRTARFECVDGVGNVTTTVTEDWTVDTIACVPDLVIAGGDPLVTPADDLDDPAPGLTVLATGAPAGGDCTEVLVGLGACSGLSGPFLALDSNQDFSLPIVLAEATGTQDVCVQVKDLAGHVSETSTTVAVRVTPPVVTFSTPQQDDKFNVATTCNKTVVVNCETGGGLVELVVDNGAATTTPCLGGTASFPITLATKNNGSPTPLEAQQTADGFTSAASISVQADCEAPVPSITSPACGGPALVLPENDLDLDAPGLQADVTVANDGIALVTLSGAAGGEITTSGSAITGLTTFSALNLGGPGNISLTACVIDGQLNTGCSASCALTIAAHPSLAITNPTAPTLFTPSSTDCDSVTAGLQVTVQGDTDAAAGSPVQLQIGSGAVKTATADGTGFSDCVDAPDGNDQTLRATVTDLVTTLTSTTSILVSVDTLPPNAILAPTFSVVNRREGKMQLNWISTLDSDGDPLAAYQVRCAATDITTQEQWDLATTPVLPVLPEVAVVTPAASAGTAQSQVFQTFKTGMTRFCVVRGVDAAGLLSPIAAGLSRTVTNPFLEKQYNSVPLTFGSMTHSLFSVAAVGDVNGDTVPEVPGDPVTPAIIRNDFIVGYAQRAAQLYFGGSALDTAADVTINPPPTPSGRFGIVVTGLGDINDDTLPDFAISAPFLNGSLGSVFVFYGRASWPATINMVAAPACAADICFHGGVASAQLGTAVTSTDFNGDGELDIVIGAQTHAPAGRVYVVLGGAQLKNLTANKVFTLSGTPSPSLDGFVIDPPTTTAGQGFGATVAAVGAGSDAFGDLVIGAVGGAVDGAAFFMPGEASGTGLLARSPGASFAQGDPGDFAFPIAALGAFDEDAISDVCVGGGYLSGGHCTVHLGLGVGFDATSVLQYTNDLADNDWSHFAADGFHSAFGLIGDLDKDNRGELAVGSLFLTPRLGTVELFYGGLAGVGDRVRSAADAHFTSAAQGHLGAFFVGDIDGDAFNDMALFDHDVDSLAPITSRLTLLY